MAKIQRLLLNVSRGRSVLVNRTTAMSELAGASRRKKNTAVTAATTATTATTAKGAGAATTATDNMDPSSTAKMVMSDPVHAAKVATTSQKGTTLYPPEFAASVAGRTKTKLGDLFGLSNFGVNYTTLDPGTSSALLHYHKTQDEFVYILEGEVTLYRIPIHSATTTSGSNSSSNGSEKNGEEEQQLQQQQQPEKVLLKAGECIGFPAGLAVAHCLRNESPDMVRFLEIGDRSPNDEVEYPLDDIQATLRGDNNCGGQWIFTRKDGTPFG